MVSSIEHFHILAHIFISLIGAILLWAIWFTIQQKFKNVLLEDNNSKRVDKGLIYISLALVTWVFSGGWYLLESDLSFKVYQIGSYLFSTANNIFLLLALFHFQYAPPFIYKNKQNVKRLIAIIGGLVICSFLLIALEADQEILGGIKVHNLPDVVLSGFISYLLLISFLSAFNRRELRIVGIIASLAVLLMFVSQLPQVFTILTNGFINGLIHIIAKTSLIFVFLVLGTIWGIQLANSPIPGDMSIEFQDWSMIKLTIPSKNIIHQSIDFGSKTTQYKNLLKFAIRRKYAPTGEQSILVGAAGELKSQTYLTRMIDNLNEILSLDDDHKLMRSDLVTFIGHGKYRLRILPENIKIDESLLDEFIKTSDNQIYEQFVSTP